METKKYRILAAVFVWCLSQVYVSGTYAADSAESSAPAGSDAAVAQEENTYVGSKTCANCHTEHYAGWKSTLHSKIEQDVIPQGPDKTVKGDFSSDDSDLTFTLQDVNMVVGSRFKQMYAQKIGADFYMLPAQWNVATKEWVKYQPENQWWAVEGIYPPEWDKQPTSKLCEGCHTVGFDIATKQPVERSVGCESCHGPGSNHAKSTKNEDIINPIQLGHQRGNMICFQCHMSGRPPKGEFETYAWPVGYKPGEDLNTYWVYAKPTGTNTPEMWAEGYARKEGVQGNTFIQGRMYTDGVSCFTCHDPHGSRHTAFTVKSGKNNSLCLTCHGEKSRPRHTHHKSDVPGSKCVVCHMPKSGKNAIEWDATDHSFRFISPLSTTKFGTPNGCNNCHTDKSPEWALGKVDRCWACH